MTRTPPEVDGAQGALQVAAIEAQGECEVVPGADRHHPQGALGADAAGSHLVYRTVATKGQHRGVLRQGVHQPGGVLRSFGRPYPIGKGLRLEEVPNPLEGPGGATPPGCGIEDDLVHALV